MGRKVLLTLSTIKYFGIIPLCSQQKMISLIVCSGIIPCCRYLSISLQITAPTFTVHAVLHLKVWALYIKKPKDTNLQQQRCTNLHCTKPPFTLLSVPDTRTDFTFCCSLNWKRNTNGIFVLSKITWELVAGELLGSCLGRFIRGKEC